MSLFGTLQRFWRGLSANLVGTAGVVLTTSSFLLFMLAEALRLLGIVTNAYVGLLTYLALPLMFVVGLVLIPIGWWIYRRRSGRRTRELLSERFDEELARPRVAGSRVIRTIALLTLINVGFLVVGGSRMLAFMDTPEFCGTACHSVMGPEWAVYQRSPHARVRCVDCHVGTGPEAALDAKLNGLWQMISITFDLYERPIPTPVHNLRPARETCERCHWPEVFYGDRLKRLVRHDPADRGSRPRYTTLSLKVGSGKGQRRGEIHWHVAAKNEVRYLAADPKRLGIRWVEARQPDGSYRRFENRRLANLPPLKLPEEQMPRQRTLDCVDCHNRATHVYEDPADAVDRMLTSGVIDRRLPFARSRAVAALTGASRPGRVLQGIDQRFRGAFQRDDPKALRQLPRAVDRAVAALQAVHRRNIHPTMKVGWNPYPDHLGHRRGVGCSRCHSPDLVDSSGRAIPHDCTLCHSMLAFESRRPFEFLMTPDPKDPECRMGRYHRREFMGGGEEGGGDPCRVPRKEEGPR